MLAYTLGLGQPWDRCRLPVTTKNWACAEPLLKCALAQEGAE
jgi:hypothetical protein